MSFRSDAVSLRDATVAVLRLLWFTAARTWWLLLGALFLTWGMLRIPQGREFFEPAPPLGQVLSILISAALICLLLGAIAVWLVTPHAEVDLPPPPAAGWFAAGITALLATGLVAVAQQAVAPAAASPKVILLVGVLSAWFTTHFGVWRDQVNPGRRATLVLWACWLALFGTPLWSSAAWAAASALLLTLAGHVVIAHVAPDEYRTASRADSGMARLVLAPVASLVVVVAGYNNAVDPVWSIGNTVGPVATLTLALGFWVGACFLIVWAASALTLLLRWLVRGRLPNLRWQTVGTACATLAMAYLLHALATGHMAASPARRMDIPKDPSWQPSPLGPPESTENWVRRRLRHMAAAGESPEAPVPVLIVAAEGGGVRAAYWTASVLAALAERYTEFGPSLVALSGVSGGSVGVTVFQGVANGALLRTDCQHHECPSNRRQAVQMILGDDFLSPALMALLVGEPLRDMGLSSRALDRAAALERGLEDRFHAVTGAAFLQEPICKLQQDADALLLPGLTDARSGKRMVLSCLPRATPSADITEPLWLTAAQPLRASTAALLSARFPFLSPTGLLSYEGQTYRIVDGGFSDNTGTGTAVDILHMVHASARELGLSARVRPIVLVISNAAPLDPEATQSALGGGVLGMIVDPLATLDAVRARNANDYRRWLDTLARRPETLATVIEWRLPHKLHGEYPLGWLLSVQTREAMNTDISQSMLAAPAKALEKATGWHVRSCAEDGVPDHERKSCEAEKLSGKR